jgi:hypothetical protein
MSARQHAAPNRNRPHTRLPWFVASAVAPLVVGIINPAIVHASEHTTPGTAISAHALDLAGNPAHADAKTAKAMTTPAATSGAATGHVMLTGCIPGLNC